MSAVERISNEDAIDGSHPLIAGLCLELPWSPRAGGSWTMARRLAWLELAVRVVDLLYTVEDAPGQGAPLEFPGGSREVPGASAPAQIEAAAAPGTDVSAIMGELDAVTMENRELRDQVADMQQQLQAALELGHAVGAEKHEDDLAELRLENETLRQRLTAELERPAQRRALEVEDELADVKRQLHGARFELEELSAGRNALLRELQQAREASTLKTVEATSKSTKAKGKAEVEAVPCRVDGCEGFGPRRGKTAGLCAEHLQQLTGFGVVLIGGKTHQALNGQLKPVAATTCARCGAKLSRYRDPGDTLCATHGGVTA